MNENVYEYEGELVLVPEKNGAYVEFPYDIREEFGKGRIKVHATFDGEAYDGSVVNMGLRNEDGSIKYIIGVKKDIREKISKSGGDLIKVTIRERV